MINQIKIMNSTEIQTLKDSLAEIFAQSIKLSKTQKDDQIASEIIDAISRADLTGEFDKDKFIEAILDLAELGAQQTESKFDDTIVNIAEQIHAGDMGIIGGIFKGIGARIKRRREARKQRRADRKANKN